MQYIISLVLGYLLGSINGSMIVSKCLGKDIRNYGSGNAGATNTLRVFGKKAVIAVSLIDFLKGIFAVLFAKLLFDGDVFVYIAGAAAILGHIFPVFFGFRGGKGVLTSFAVMIAAQPLAALIIGALAIAIMAITKYVSLGSCIGALLFIIYPFVFFKSIELCVFCVFCGVTVIVKHKSNIKRLLNGTERKLGEKSE